MARDRVETTGRAKALGLSSESSRIESDGCDLAFVNLAVFDSRHRVVPTASILVTFKVEGLDEGVGEVCLANDNPPGER